MSRFWCRLFITIVLHTVSGCDGALYHDVIEFQNRLLTNYSKAVIPVTNQTEALHLHLTFRLKSMEDLDEATGALTVVMEIEMTWTDQILTWTADDGADIQELSVPVSTLWTPALFLMNTGNNAFRFDFGDRENTYASVTNEGETRLLIGQSLTTKCIANILYYPMDKHDCEVLVSTMKSSNEINVSATIDTSGLMQNVNWEILSTSSLYHMYKYPTTGLQIRIRRRSGTTFVGQLLPVFSLGVVNLFVFLIPIESGERVSFAMTVMLSFAVFLTIIEEKMPRNGMETSLLCVYLAVLLIYSCAIAFLTVLLIGKFYYGHLQLPLIATVQGICISRKINQDSPPLSRNDATELKPKMSNNDNENNETSKFCRKADKLCVAVFSLFHFLFTLGIFIRIVFEI